MELINDRRCHLMSDAADALGVHQVTFKKRCKDIGVPTAKKRGDRKHYIMEEDLVRLIHHYNLTPYDETVIPLSDLLEKYRPLLPADEVTDASHEGRDETPRLMHPLVYIALKGPLQERQMRLLVKEEMKSRGVKKYDVMVDITPEAMDMYAPDLPSLITDISLGRYTTVFVANRHMSARIYADVFKAMAKAHGTELIFLDLTVPLYDSMEFMMEYLPWHEYFLETAPDSQKDAVTQAYNKFLQTKYPLSASDAEYIRTGVEPKPEPKKRSKPKSGDAAEAAEETGEADEVNE